MTSPNVGKSFIRQFLERKQMSTKTILKRVALVAAVALTLGGVSGVAANAAGSAAGNTVSFTPDASISGTGTLAASFTLESATAYGTVLTANWPGSTTTTISPALPTGLSYDGTTGILSATGAQVPAAAKAYTVTTVGSPSKSGTFYLTIHDSGSVTPPPPAGTSDQPWLVAGGTIDPVTGTTSGAAIAASATSTIDINALVNTKAVSGIDPTSKAGEYRYLTITSANSAFTAATAGFEPEGAALGSAVKIDVPTSGAIQGNFVSVKTVTAGTITAEFHDYTAVANTINPGTLTVTDTVLQKIVITVTAAGPVSAVTSTAYINGSANTVYTLHQHQRLDSLETKQFWLLQLLQQQVDQHLVQVQKRLKSRFT